jgi:hypothetical protein
MNGDSKRILHHLQLTKGKIKESVYKSRKEEFIGKNLLIRSRIMVELR